MYFFASKELIACGSANILGSFFSCFPVSGSLSRSVIQESIARTQVFENEYCTTSKVYFSCSFFFKFSLLIYFVFQLCTIPVVIVIILVLLFIAPLFYHLPKVSKKS